MPSSPELPQWIRHRVLPDEAGTTVEELLRGPLGISGRRLQRLGHSRGFRVNGRAAHTSQRLKAGDWVEVRALDAPPPPSATPVPELPEDAIRLEEPGFVVVDKPAVMAVHPPGGGLPTLVEVLAARDRARGIRAGVHPVHRLDRGSSGLLLIARSPGEHAGLDALLREGKIERHYLALTSGVPALPEGWIDAPLGPDPRRPGRQKVRPDGKAARTHYRVLRAGEVRRGAGGGEAALVELVLDTGRTHQIRAHLAHLGTPLLGDPVYGGARVSGLLRPALHSCHLAFPHPVTGVPVVVGSPLPPDLALLLPDPTLS
jgi:23S rRNA pseudouridine1911/1915/1917 synthase